MRIITMMKKKIHILLLLLLAPIYIHAHTWGIVLDENGAPLVGANVWWLNTSVGASTDTAGHFTLEPVKSTNLLVTSYIGCHNDTTEIRGHRSITIVLVNDRVLDEVTISERKMGVLRSRVTALDVQTLTGEELCKAACCNLSESFETNASVDVSYADAATGAKQIRLLGLGGTYVQMLTENTPNIRGLAQSFGMEYIPGPWMQAIQVSKGTSSVVNGYEAMTGQINVDYLHPHIADPLAINGMLSRELHAELNLTGGWKVDEVAQTALLVHAQGNFLEMDDNHDGFKDMPTGYHVNLLNRWGFKKGIWGSKLAVRGLYDRREAGQTGQAQRNTQSTTGNAYAIDLRTRRVDGFWKNGFTFDNDLNRSLGLIASVSYHNQTNRYGSRVWDAKQTNVYFNAIFQTDFDDDMNDPEDLHNHRLSAGASVNYDRYDETMQEDGPLFVRFPLFNPYAIRNEVTPGVFAEYTYSYTEKLTLLAGIRGDWSSQYGFFATPRMNIRYAPFPWWTLRGSVGLGYRSPVVFADNAAYLSSNRIYCFGGSRFAQEQALNTGATMTFYIPLGNKEMQLIGEYYYTRFLDGVIADIDNNRHSIVLYNLKDIAGAQSFAHNWQVEASMEILRGWTLMAAFRYTDVRQTTFNAAAGEYQLREKALQNRFKGIITTSYQTPLKKWQFDFTAQFNGPGRMPDGFVNPNNGQYYQKGGQIYHTWYPQLMAQITKYFRTASIYVGAENMTNFTQKNPIVGGTIAGSTYIDPTSPDYDASMVWGPIHGWKLYIGFRWSLQRPDED